MEQNQDNINWKTYEVKQRALLRKISSESERDYEQLGSRGQNNSEEAFFSELPYFPGREKSYCFDC